MTGCCSSNPSPVTDRRTPSGTTSLAKLFDGATPGLVHVIAFQSRAIITKYLGDISRETEVWCADAPTHLIHFQRRAISRAI